jgi:beta-galactosidase
MMFPFGADYYPEHWPEQRWATDARLMAEAGINTVRLAEFAWSKLEPEPGRFDFGWLDRAIALLAEQGIRVILGTPTASMPPWLAKNHPDVFMRLQDGTVRTYGNRRNYCPTNATYRQYSQRITREMAGHYCDNDAVIGWQTDNELGGQTNRCFCESCRAAFGDWLQQRYGSLDEVNEKWGTVFWSHIYNDWAEIPTPAATGSSPNPGLALDYYRFASDAYVDFQQEQIDILRERCPGKFITHNLMGFYFDTLDYYRLAAPLDFAGYDIYVRMQWTVEQEVDPSSAALSHDSIRGLKQQNHWVIEQQSGPGGWEIVSVAPRPGELRLWAYQSIAHGADGIIFFRWRTALFGTEEYWHGVLDHHGEPGRRYREIAQMGAELAEHGERIHGSAVKAEVAILHDYDTTWAFQIQQNNPNFHYPRHVHDIYRGFWRQNVPVDLVHPAADLAGYKLVVAPALYVLPEPVAANLRQFARDGGTVLLTARSGVKDEANAVVAEKLPGLLAEMAGVTVAEYDSRPSWAENPLAAEDEALAGEALTSSVWADVLEPTTAEVVARYTGEYYAGAPAITLNRYGEGQVVYAGTLGDSALFARLTVWLGELAGVEPLLETPDGVEATARWQNGQRLLFLLNHNDETATVSLDRDYRNLLDGDEADSSEVKLGPYDVMILH